MLYPTELRARGADSTGIGALVTVPALVRQRRSRHNAGLIHEHGTPAMSLFDLSGKVALITGSSRGIGKAIAQQLAAHGARVVISSRKADSCEAVAAEINAAGGSAFAHACHVGHKQELQALVDASVAKWGRIDIVVGNAATNPTFGASIDTPDEVFEKIIHTNLLSNV